MAGTALLPAAVLIPLLSPDREFLLHALILLILFTTDIFENKFFRKINFSLRIIWFTYLLTRILIIPFSSFLLWFDLAGSQKAAGSISSLFIGLTLFFSSAASLFFLHRKPLPAVAGSILSLLFILAVVYDSSLALTALILTALLLLLVTRKKIFSVKKGTPGKGILFPLGIAIAAALLFSMTESRGGSFLVDRFIFSGLRGVIASNFPDFPLLELTPGFGYGYSSIAAGERPVFTSTHLLLVEGTPFHRYYLREGIYSTYKAGSWNNDFPDYILPELMETEFTDGDESGVPEYPEAEDQATITIMADFNDNLLSTLDTVQIQIDRSDGSDFTARDGGIKINLPLTREERYRLITKSGSDTTAPPAEIFSSQDSIPMGVADLARRLKDPAGDPVKTAGRITAYLVEGYTYSLDTEEPKGDLAAHFLFYSRKGYCVHFATSFILLYRACGFPARFVSGYLAEMYKPADVSRGILDPQPVTSRRLNGYSSHTWPEIWLPNQGWITWEATPPMITSDFTTSSDPYTRRSLLETDRLEEDLPEKQSAAWKDFELWMIIAGGISVTAFLFVVLLLSVVRRGTKTTAMIKRISEISRKIEIPPPDETGWRDWTRKTGAAVGRKAITDRLGMLIERAVYSRGKNLSPRDLGFIRSYGHFLRKTNIRKPFR